MAKYGRYLDAEDRRKNASGEADSDLVLLGLLLGFPFVIMGSLALNGNLQRSDNTDALTCPQAQTALENALDARDAITPQEAMTGFGRAKWEQLRDKANELEQVKNSACN